MLWFLWTYSFSICKGQVVINNRWIRHLPRRINRNDYRKNSTHSPTRSPSKTGIPNLWVVNLYRDRQNVNRKKRRRRNNPKIFHVFPIFFKKYLITNIVSGNIDRNNNYSPMKILFTDKSDSDSEGQWRRSSDQHSTAVGYERREEKLSSPLPRA